ncbi:putative toxin-antitoxin system toxin component, PIN family [Chryseotalea sanaruensis]|uniref:Putative toxin-antitoxin system toxin component, PIN family n=1 Tax=Chryseotalea sanaruensis TaxID=2482724 RepID=A0A401U904_9BACT|nr:putative toxin-antitoxin system toxin component, PIN family [Chryseotalea sanaruensis]GCC51383.1 putative toxin-antitoxin system toxin component, PIN family [Chryseotalea sanaruensis]
MPKQKPSKVIIDTNLWISFLIGKELQNLKDLIVTEKIQLISTEQLISELRIVVNRPKLQKYFDKEKVTELISLLNIVSEKVKIKKIESICRDPKDDFLLALSKQSKANYLVTGDKDLLEIKIYGRTEIITVKKFIVKIN